MLTLSLGVAGAAHRVPTAESLQLQAYQLTGLQMDLCGNSDHTLAMPGCPICTLIGAAIIPKPLETLSEAERRVQTVTYLPMIARARHNPRDPTTPLRGPPSLLQAGLSH